VVAFSSFSFDRRTRQPSHARHGKSIKVRRAAW
jgi:hypothetical protein